MKKLFVLLTASAALAASIGSCSKNKTDIPCTATADTVNTYNKTVKSILDAHCAFGGCHDAATAASGIVLDSYAAAKDAATNQSNFFCVIDWTCGPRMPQGAAQPLPDSLINLIKLWRDNCLAQ
ncbi:MAG: hypothetical protein RML37_12085 [Chitinophagales bacterium]|nr:hypothetical protein [Chitinophagales bacterium]